MSAPVAPCRVAVIDAESVPDDDALSQAPRHSRGGQGRPSLHRVVAATVLTCMEGPAGFGEVDIRTFAHPAMSEVDIVGCVDLMLPDPGDGASRLVSWNGAHDLRLLRHRACSNWMFGLSALRGWCGAPAGVHVDVMEAISGGDPRGRWALADVCAGLGFAVRNGVSGQPVLTLHSRGRHEAVAEHCLLDVIGTFIAYGYHRAFETGDDRFAATAWATSAAVLDGIARADVNVQSLAAHHLVSVARARLTLRHAPPSAASDAPDR